MAKYYRVRTPEQWDWLKNKLEIEDDWHKVNADMWKAVEKYERKKRNRSFDYDKKHNDQFRIF